MKVKYLLVLLIIILLTGCNVTSSIEVDSDFNIKETTNISFNNKLADAYYSTSEYAKNFTDYYKSAINIKNYNYDIVEGKENSSVIFTKQSNDICKQINESLFSQYLYKDVKCEEDDNYIQINSYGEHLLSLPENKKKFDVDEVNLKITLPVKAEEDNADGVNNNTYTWVFDKNTSKSKSIYIKINKEDIKEEKKQEIKRNERKKTVSKIKLIGVVIILFTILIVVFYMLYKKYKSNKLEY